MVRATEPAQHTTPVSIGDSTCPAPTRHHGEDSQALFHIVRPGRHTVVEPQAWHKASTDHHRNNCILTKGGDK